MRPTPWRAPQHASAILEKVRNLTSEMQIVQQELCAELAFPDGTPKTNILCADPRSAGELGLLRNAVDQFRRVLWFYLEQVALDKNLAEPGLSPPDRVPRKGPSTSAMTPQSAHPAITETQPLSFFDRLDLVIEGYLRSGGQLTSPRKPPKSQ